MFGVRGAKVTRISLITRTHFEAETNYRSGPFVLNNLTMACYPSISTFNLAQKHNMGIFAILFEDMLYRLSEMKSGAYGVIKRFDENDAQVKLMEMGCIPGEKVSVEAIAPLGDPIAIQVSGYCLSIRKNEAKYIWVEVA